VEDDCLLDPEGLAAYLNIPIRTIYQWRHAGKGPRGYKVGRHLRFRRAEVDVWLERQANPTAAAEQRTRTRPAV
jgi:excisionase family DNA binding protein